MFDHTYFVDRK
jgi:hypothetical protein